MCFYIDYSLVRTKTSMDVRWDNIILTTHQAMQKNKVSSRKISVQSLFYPYSKFVLLPRSLAYSGIFSVNRVPTGNLLLHVCTRNVKTYAYDDSNIIIIIIIARTMFKDCCHQSRAIARVSWGTWRIENIAKRPQTMSGLTNRTGLSHRPAYRQLQSVLLSLSLSLRSP